MKYILLVNPNGGKKRGPKILKQIKPLFDSHGIDLFIIETTFAGHAREIINQIDLSEFNGIIGIGGDGTLHEITNGLLSRKYPHILPIGIIPGGAGNSYMHDITQLILSWKISLVVFCFGIPCLNDTSYNIIQIGLIC